MDKMDLLRTLFPTLLWFSVDKMDLLRTLFPHSCGTLVVLSVQDGPPKDPISDTLVVLSGQDGPPKDPISDTLVVL